MFNSVIAVALQATVRSHHANASLWLPSLRRRGAGGEVRPTLRHLALAEGAGDDGRQLLPLDAGLAAMVELVHQPGVDLAQPWIVLGEIEAEALAQHEDKARDTA